MESSSTNGRHGQQRSQGGQEGAAAPPIIARDEFCNSPKSVEKLKGGGVRLHFSPTIVAAWFVNVIKET